LAALAGAYFLVAAAYYELYVGGQYIRVCVGKGLYGLGIDVHPYSEDIAIGIMDYSFLDIALLAPTVGLKPDSFANI